jgi:hypothetical protein
MDVRSNLFKEVKKSHEEVKEYREFFKNYLKYDKVIDITDKAKMKQINLRSKIIDELETLVSKCDGIGKNPFTVNVITYSGHGFTFDGDAIAVIPEYEGEKKSED